MTFESLPHVTYYMAVSQKNWELLNSRIWLAPLGFNFKMKYKVTFFFKLGVDQVLVQLTRGLLALIVIKRSSDFKAG